MEFFKLFSSNTLAGSGNQAFYISDDEHKIHTCRIYYKIFKEGRYNYSFLFSNTIDTTFSDPLLSHKNLVIDSWKITEAKAGVCNISHISKAAQPNNTVSLTFNGNREKTVNPAELFCSDPVELEFCANDFLCLQISFMGRVLPYHPETLLPSFVLENGEWIPSVFHPFPSMIGCDRHVSERIAFIGDSITQGIGTEKNSYTHWNALLAEMLGKDYAYWNLGLGFARADDAASDGAWLFKAKQNDVVFVCLGVNDIITGISAESITDSLEKVIDCLNSCGITVFLQTVPPFDYCGDAIEKWQRVNDYIRNVLSKKVSMMFDNVEVLKLNAEQPYMAAYGGHPDAVGCRAWAKALYEALKCNDFRL